jgi:hypothetical protein
MDKIELKIVLSKRQFQGGLAALMIVGLSFTLTAENVTMSTYYPAPSGVYGRLITTQDTMLGRDGTSSVTLGSATAPAAGTKLAVMGGRVGIGTLTPGAYGATPALLDVAGPVAANDVWLKGVNRWASQAVPTPTVVTVQGVGPNVATATCPVGTTRISCGGARDAALLDNCDEDSCGYIGTLPYGPRGCRTSIDNGGSSEAVAVAYCISF